MVCIVPHTTTYLSRDEMTALGQKTRAGKVGEDIINWIAEVKEVDENSVEATVITFSGARFRATPYLGISKQACHTVHFRLKCGGCGNPRCDRVATLDGRTPEIGLCNQCQQTQRMEQTHKSKECRPKKL